MTAKQSTASILDESMGIRKIRAATLVIMGLPYFSIQLLQPGHVESRYRLVKSLEAKFAYRFSCYQFLDEAEHLL